MRKAVHEAMNNAGHSFKGIVTFGEHGYQRGNQALGEIGRRSVGGIRDVTVLN